MLQAYRERLALLLMALLPLHALLVTVLTKALAGPGHAPLPALALWKEGVLALVLLLAAAECMRAGRKVFHLDRLDACIAGLLLLSVLATAFTHGDWKLYLIGFKYDFVPLIAFFLLRRVRWSERFFSAAAAVLLGAGGAVALYGFFTLVAPLSFFRALGYSDLHSLYVPNAPLAAFQQVGGTALRRMQSTMSGPNQLGLWLLLPWSLALLALLGRIPRQAHLRSTLHASAYAVIIGGAVLFTFSRTAWVAAAAVALGALWTLPKSARERYLVRGAGLCMALTVFAALVAPEVMVRIASSRDHFRKPLAALQTMAAHPLGLGLGAAGPASNRVSDACVFLEAGADAAWAADRPDLCVFVGGAQAQPAGRACQCPTVTENWYLQMGVEMGVAGLALFTALTLLLLLRLAPVPQVFLPFLGVSIAGLFLHAWEGPDVSYTLWLLAAATCRFRLSSV